MNGPQQKPNGDELNYEALAPSMPSAHAGEEAAAIATNAVLNLLPGVGGAMSSIFSGGLAITDRRRQENWLRQLAAAVDHLMLRTDLRLRDITEDEGFATAVMRALRIVRETNNAEKLRILVNAACNSGGWTAHGDPMQSLFMRLLEQYEPEHVFVLRACDNPQEFMRNYESSAGGGHWHEIFENIIYAGNAQWEPLGAMILRDIGRDRLHHHDEMGFGFSLAGERSRLTTPLGHAFLDYCSDQYSSAAPTSQ